MNFKLGMVEKNILGSVLKKLDKYLIEKGGKTELPLLGINNWLEENGFPYRLVIRDHIIILEYVGDSSPSD